MARDRRRAKQRKDRQARSAGGGQARPVDAPEREREPDAPSHQHTPAELATGEVDLAEAQLAMNRPDPEDGTPLPPADQMDAAGAAEVEEEAAFEALEDRVDDAEAAFEQEAAAENGHAEASGAVVRSRRAAARRGEPREGNRLMTFLRGSWRELQRVQWPDRRQVGQATAVVIGFVIVAGAFLGLADYVAAKVVDIIV